MDSESSNDSIHANSAELVSGNMCRLVCHGGEIIVNTEIANLSGLIKSMNEIESDETVDIPVPIVDIVTMKRVVQFMQAYKKHPFDEITAPLTKDTVLSYVKEPVHYQDFAEIDINEFAELVHAADYLDFQPMLTFLLAQFAIKLRDNSSADIAGFFNVMAGFTEEEEKRVLDENLNYLSLNKA